MTKNYIILSDIIKNNYGKVATYRIEEYSHSFMETVLSFEEGNTIKFYFSKDCNEYLELIEFKPFKGLVASIELKEKKINSTHDESATKTHLLINGKKHSTWIVHSNGHYSESINWWLEKTREQLAEEEKIIAEQKRLKQEKINKEKLEKLEKEKQKYLEERKKQEEEEVEYLKSLNSLNEIIKNKKGMFAHFYANTQTLIFEDGDRIKFNLGEDCCNIAVENSFKSDFMGTFFNIKLIELKVSNFTRTVLTLNDKNHYIWDSYNSISWTFEPKSKKNLN